MPSAGVRISDVLYERIRQQAKSRNLSLSDFIRDAVEQVLNNVEQNEPHHHNGNGSSPAYAMLHEQLQVKDEQLLKKDAQIEQLHQLMAMGHKERETLASQLNDTHLQLEDLRQRNWWKRLWGR